MSPADLHGEDRLTATLAQAADDLSTAGAGVVPILGPAVVSATPRKSGALAATVAVQVSDGLVQVTAGSPAVTYAPPVHKLNPWIARTIDQREADILDAWTTGVEKVLARVEGT